MVRLRCDSFWEKALIPAFVFFFAMLYPFAWVADPRRRTAAAAGGCMLVRREALERAGGLAAIRGATIDDCALARLLKGEKIVRPDQDETPKDAGHRTSVPTSRGRKDPTPGMTPEPQPGA